MHCSCSTGKDFVEAQCFVSDLLKRSLHRLLSPDFWDVMQPSVEASFNSLTMLVDIVTNLEIEVEDILQDLSQEQMSAADTQWLQVKLLKFE